MTSTPEDLVARRNRLARLSTVGRRAGYGCLGLAVVLFALGAAGRFTTALTAAITACLAAGSVVLVPAIIVGYGVRAAEREDRGSG